MPARTTTSDTKYAEVLGRYGIKLELKTSKGSLENASRLSDPLSGVKVALIQGGTVSAKDVPHLVSLGQVYQEPLWIFYRGDATKTRLTDLTGLRLSIGPEGSGTRILSSTLLEANDMRRRSTQLFDYGHEEAKNELIAGEIDAICSRLRR